MTRCSKVWIIASVHQMRASAPPAPDMGELGAEIPELGHLAGWWEDVLWKGLAKPGEIECRVFDVTGPRGQRSYWVAGDRIIQVTGRREVVAATHKWMAQHARRGSWRVVSAALKRRDAGISDLKKGGRAEIRRFKNTRHGLRKTVWGAAHRLAWHFYDPDTQAPGVFEHATQGLWRAETILEIGAKPVAKDWWLRGDLLNPGPADRGEQYRDLVLDWVAKLYEQPPPWAWWIEHFVARGYTGAECVRGLSGKKLSCARVVASLLIGDLKALPLA